MNCDNNDCDDVAVVEFIDWTKPTNIFLCAHHALEHRGYYEKEGYLYKIKPIKINKNF